MATIAQSLPSPSFPLAWVRDFLREELAPYPGRVDTVFRMVLAATVVMLLVMTFRIPYGFLGVVYALLITRESPRATLKSSAMIFLLGGIGTAYLLVCARLFISSPSMHFLWIVGSFFLAFYVLSAVSNYAAASTFAIVIAVSVPIWDRHLSAETNVEDTLWLVFSALLGVLTTIVVELALVRMKRGDEIVLPVAERLATVESLLLDYAKDRHADDRTINEIIRLDMVGTSRLRPLLRRGDYSPNYRAQMSSVVILAGRLVELTTALTELTFDFTDGDRQRVRNLAAAVARIRTDLVNRQIPAAIHFNPDDEAFHRVPWLREMENIVSLIPQAFVGSRAIETHRLPADEVPQSRLVAADAFGNPEHLKFALKGCLAASACYMIYSLVAWQGIGVAAVTTTLLTALSTIGASRQRQILRFGAVLLGGVLLGIGPQIYILPYVDSIVGFTILCIAVITLISWFMTSSPRLSYFGLQLALAFAFIHLQEFRIQTSLAIARDRIVGVLLGLFMMWLVFDQLWGAPAALEMKRQFISGLRWMAQFAREPVSKDRRVAVARSYSLRETILNTFDEVRGVADGVLFEFGASRHEDLALRKQILRWQPHLRMLFVTRIVLWKYRVPMPGFELPGPVAAAQQDFDDHLAAVLDAMADRLEGRAGGGNQDLAGSLERLEQTVQTSLSPEPQEALATRLRTFLSLCRRVVSLTLSLENEK